MDHDRVFPEVQRAVLDAARAILGGDPDAAHEAADRACGLGGCPPCEIVCALQLGFALVARFTGEKMFVSESLRLQLAAAIDAAQAELDSSAN